MHCVSFIAYILHIEHFADGRHVRWSLVEMGGALALVERDAERADCWASSFRWRKVVAASAWCGMFDAAAGPLAVAGHQHGDQVRDVALRQPERFDLGQLAVLRLGRDELAQGAERRVDAGWNEKGRKARRADQLSRGGASTATTPIVSHYGGLLTCASGSVPARLLEVAARSHTVAAAAAARRGLRTVPVPIEGGCCCCRAAGFGSSCCSEAHRLTIGPGTCAFEDSLNDATAK